jgi:hypothetical protein
MEAPPGTLIELFDKIAGYPGYIGLMLLTMAVLWTVLYLPWIVYGRVKAARGMSMEEDKHELRN